MTIAAEARAGHQFSQGWLTRLFDYKPFLVFICLLPALGLLLVFLSYPLGLGVWLAFTDTRIGRAGYFIGFENFQSLWHDPVFITSVWNTLLYTSVATIGKFALGLWLALLLNNHLPFKSLLRALILVPWIVPTVLSAIAFWWIYDPQFSIISYILVDVLGWRETYIDFLGAPWPARFSLIAANIWRGIPFVAISLLAGLQTISPALYEAAMLDGANAWQRFRYVILPVLRPTFFFLAVIETTAAFQVFDVIYVMTQGGPANASYSLVYMLYDQGFRYFDYGYAAAIGVALFIMTLVVALIQRLVIGKQK